MPVSELAPRCPHCAPTVEKYGENYHRVYARPHGADPRDPDTKWQCEQCGGVRQPDGKWLYKCRKCGTEPEPGGLTGLFVPHLCRPCEQAQADRDKATGNVCLKCHTVRSRCCC